jgi:hypothetical protein
MVPREQNFWDLEFPPRPGLRVGGIFNETLFMTLLSQGLWVPNDAWN